MMGVQVTDEDLLKFKLPNLYEDEVTWLLGNYFAKVWMKVFLEAVDEIKLDEFFGFLTFKFKEDHLGARHPLNPIPGIV